MSRDRDFRAARAEFAYGEHDRLDDAGVNRLRVAGLRVFRTVERVAGFGLVLGLVMGSSEVMRRRPPHHLSPAQAITRQG
jgi:hypothetical protein